MVQIGLLAAGRDLDLGCVHQPAICIQFQAADSRLVAKVADLSEGTQALPGAGFFEREQADGLVLSAQADG